MSETLDELARRLVQEENERTAKRKQEESPVDKGQGITVSTTNKQDEELTDNERLKKYEPHKLKEMATNEIVAKCNELVDRGWVTSWEIRNILREIAPSFAKSKYMPGYGG